MTLPNLWSRRKKQTSATDGDPLIYDRVPDKLRVQIAHIVRDLFAQADQVEYGIASGIKDVMCRELGVFSLKAFARDDADELVEWFVETDNVDAQLDMIEAVVKFSSVWRGQWSAMPEGAVEKAVAVMNARMAEAAFGYRIERREVISLSDEYTHSQVVVPALQLLYDPAFTAAQNEFLAAHESLRNQDYEAAIHECAKSMESVLKVIAKARKWPRIDDGSSIKALIAAAFADGLLESYMEASLNALRALMESSVPTVRNRSGGHGAGTVARNVPEHLARFQVHQTAAVIRLIVEAHQTKGVN